jgi:hypothetical protein
MPKMNWHMKDKHKCATPFSGAFQRVQFRDQWQSFARINAVGDPDEVFAMASEHYLFAEYFRP